MYIITITTPKGVFEEKINNMVDIGEVLVLYPDYTSMSAAFQPGEIQEEQKEKKEEKALEPCSYGYDNGFSYGLYDRCADCRYHCY